MNRTLTVLARNFANLVYPLRCAVCSRDLDPLDELHVCGLCMGDIKRNPEPYCRSCGRSVSDSRELCGECRKTNFRFERAYAACLYEGVAKELLHRFKYGAKPQLAKILSALMADFIRANDEIVAGIDAVTFVPLQAGRLRERGFNQTKVLASFVSREFNIPLLDTLRKARATRPQNELARNERLVNLKGAFQAIRGADIKGRAMLLIDDVITTGATLGECSAALLDAGAKTVRCLAVARGN